MQSRTFRSLSVALIPVGAVLLALVTGCASTGDQQRFATPEAACEVLVAAMRANDTSRLESVLGSEGIELLSSGDDVADRSNRNAFLEAYAAGHAVVLDGDEAVLVVGADDWPLPLPLVHADDAWYFDVERAKDEVLAVRIGGNELSTIEVCRAIVDAQREYAGADRTGRGAGEYAARFLSTKGKRDGLFWPTTAGEAESPLGALVAEAAAEGYTGKAIEAGVRQPYHGYLLRMLTAQGPSAPGGAMSYVVGGRMTGGFAVLAEPAEYNNSGVMTFLVGPAGIVYQRDLGAGTAQAAGAIQTFDPDMNWSVVDG